MPTAFAQQAIRIHVTGGLTAAEITRATGASPAAAHSWLRGDRSPSRIHSERLAELATLVERLTAVMPPGDAQVWLRKPLPALADRKPLDLVRAGRYRSVARLVAELEARQEPTT